ncbi:MAG TPA: c-type cytochrome [Blastocatellia bacterium]|nr:c-type cytochrome [Blastocatellia bacterium]
MKRNGRAFVTTILGLVIIGVMYATPRTQESAQRSVWDGVYTDEQSKRGKEIYIRECSKCHGPDLAGVDEAPALTGGAFLANWSGLTVGDLFERVRISMPPNKKGVLSRQQIVDVLSQVLSANGFPAGKTELDLKTEQLKQIRIDPTRPKADSK